MNTDECRDGERLLLDDEDMACQATIFSARRNGQHDPQWLITVRKANFRSVL